MVDSVLVLPPGFRVTDASDNPVNNAKIKFREAGPGATKTVYSDANLSVALGHTVRTRSDGQPVVSEGSSTTTLIYVGSDPYHIEVTDQNDAIIVPAKDNVKGAAVLSPVVASIPPIPVITTGSPLTLTAAHKGSLINANGNTLTFTDAVTLGDGWHVYLRNGGSSGQVILVASSGISFEGQSFTQRALLIGEGMHIACDGTAFRVITHAQPLMSPQGPGVVLIADRITAAPGSPVAGGRYIVETAFSSYSQHQIIEWNGTTFNAYTPPTDCGWIAYVQDEDRFHTFRGTAWVLGLEPDASDTVKGLIELAVQAEMETATDVVRAVPPGRQHFHPTAVKAWGEAGVTGNILASHGVTSVTDGGTGDITWNLSVTFSSTNFSAVAAARTTGTGSVRNAIIDALTATTIRVRVVNESGTATDPTAHTMMAAGDLA